MTVSYPPFNVTSDPNLQSDDDTALTSNLLFRVSRLIWLISPPIWISLGTFGHVMTVAIMRRIASSESSISVYFTSLALADLCVLYGCTLRRWTEKAMGLQPMNYSTVSCKFLTYFTLTYPLSAWFLVSLTVHRAVSVVWPHRVSLLLTRHRVRLINLSLLLFFLGLYSHCLAWFQVIPHPDYPEHEPACYPSGDGYVYFLFRVFPVVDMTFYSLLPFLGIGVSNVLLVWKLTVSLMQTRTNLTGTSTAPAGAPRKRPLVDARARAAHSVTLTVMVVSLTFIVLTLPSCVHYILYYFDQQRAMYDGEQRARVEFFEAAAYLMVDCNHAVSFYLYGLTGRRFRREFWDVLRSGQRLVVCAAARLVGRHADKGSFWE